MKRLIILGIAGLLLYGAVVFGGARTITDGAGQGSLTTYNVDSDTLTAVFTPVLLINASQNLMYDRLVLYLRAQNPVKDPAMGGSIDANVGNTDTVIFKTFASFNSSVDTISTDTVFPGVISTDSGFVTVEYYTDLAAVGTPLGDSTALQPLTEEKKALMFDKFWVEVVVIDAAGDGDTLLWTFDYKYRLIELSGRQ